MGVSELPDFLPELAETDGAWGEVCAALYAVYDADFRTGAILHQGLRVHRDRRVLDDGDGKEECFWHLITGHDNAAGERVFEPDRAKRLPWVKPLIVASACPELLVFDRRESKRLRRYLWLKDHDFVVILERKKDIYYLVTAYAITYRSTRHKMERRAKQAPE
jgi:hypothetical protein